MKFYFFLGYLHVFFVLQSGILDYLEGFTVENLHKVGNYIFL